MVPCHMMALTLGKTSPGGRGNARPVRGSGPAVEVDEAQRPRPTAMRPSGAQNTCLGKDCRERAKHAETARSP